MHGFFPISLRFATEPLVKHWTLSVVSNAENKINSHYTLPVARINISCTYLPLFTAHYSAFSVTMRCMEKKRNATKEIEINKIIPRMHNENDCKTLWKSGKIERNVSFGIYSSIRVLHSMFQWWLTVENPYHEMMADHRKIEIVDWTWFFFFVFVSCAMCVDIEWGNRFNTKILSRKSK